MQVLGVREKAGPHAAHVITWAGMRVGDDGKPQEMTDYADRSVQVFGTYGVGGAVRLEGSNDGAHWAVLSDPQGNELLLGEDSVRMVAEITRYVRPVIPSGDAATALTVALLVREVTR